MQSDNEQGHALALVVMVLTVLMVIAVGLAQLGVRAADQSRARTAADAVALAAASGGLEAGRRLATANHATLTALIFEGGVVRVTVQVGSMTATAAATLVDAG
jgi:TRAP-type mannitol/chloroaromatic compound transport system permease large subunit